MQYTIVFSASKAQKPGEAGGVLLGLGVGPRSGQYHDDWFVFVCVCVCVCVRACVFVCVCVYVRARAARV